MNTVSAAAASAVKVIYVATILKNIIVVCEATIHPKHSVQFFVNTLIRSDNANIVTAPLIAAANNQKYIFWPIRCGLYLRAAYIQKLLFWQI